MSELANAAKQANEWLAKRDRYIVQARKDGLTLREIAAQTGLTHPGVAKIVKRGTK